MSENDYPVENTVEVEDALKALLDKMLDYFQKFIKNEEDLQELEKKLNDYENLTSLVAIITEVFDSLTLKVDGLVSKDTNENYDDLERVVQKYEGEIRTHIQIEQQLKLYAESLQSKIEDSEKNRTGLLDQTKSMINDIKRDNQKLAESCKRLKEDNKALTQRAKELENIKQDYEGKLASYPYLQERLTAVEKITRQSENSMVTYEVLNNKSIPDTRSVNIEIQKRPSAKQGGIQKVLKTYNIKQQSSASPLRISNRQSSLGDATKCTETLKTRMEHTEADQARDLEALKRSYQQRRHSNARDRTSISKTRELKSMNSQSNVGQNVSNTSLVFVNKAQVKPKETMRETVNGNFHKKSRSSCASPKMARASLTKKEFEKFLLYSNTKVSDSVSQTAKLKHK